MAPLVPPRLVSPEGTPPVQGPGSRGPRQDDDHAPAVVAPVAFGVLLGASLGVMLAAVLDANANLMFGGMHVTGPLAGWCIGALLGGLSGGLLSAFIGWELDGRD